MTTGLAFYAALIRHRPGRIARVLVIVFLAGLAEGFGLLLLAPLIRLLGATGSGSQPPLGLAHNAHLPLVLSVFVAVGFARIALIRQRDIVLGDIQIGYANSLRQRLYGAVADAEWLWLTRTRRSDLLQALTGDVARVGMATRLSLEMVGSALLIVVYLAVAALLAPAVTLIAIAAAAVMVPFARPQLRRSAAHGQRLTRGNREQFATAAEFLDGIKLAKSFGRTDAHVDAFGAALTLVFQ